MALALRTRLKNLPAHPLQHLLPENFFPVEAHDIYDETIFPHEWNYGLPDFPLPLHLSVSDNPREGDLEFEYSPDRPGWDDVWQAPGFFKKKFRRLPKRRAPDVLHFPQPADVLPPPEQVEDGFHMSLAELIDRAKVRCGPSGEFPTPEPPTAKTWHYIWQTKKVLACTGKGCQLCLR